MQETDGITTDVTRDALPRTLVIPPIAIVKVKGDMGKRSQGQQTGTRSELVWASRGVIATSTRWG